MTVEIGRPRITVSKSFAVGFDPSGLLYVDLKLADVGTGNARDVRLNQVGVSSVSGVGRVTVDTSRSPPLPFLVGNLDIGEPSHTIRFYFELLKEVPQFSLHVAGTMQDVAGANLAFSIDGSVIVPPRRMPITAAPNLSGMTQ